jgi:hypothetical protein
MRLVYPSRKREILSVLAVLLLGLGASLLATGQDADARPTRPAQVGASLLTAPTVGFEVPVP